MKIRSHETLGNRKERNLDESKHKNEKIKTIDLLKGDCSFFMKIILYILKWEKQKQIFLSFLYFPSFWFPDSIIELHT